MDKQDKMITAIRDLVEELENCISEISQDRVEVAIDELQNQSGTISAILEGYDDE